MKNWRIDDLDEGTFRTIREGSKIVADVWGASDSVYPKAEEMQENANLIASAPEMLDALDKCLSDLHMAIYNEALSGGADHEDAISHANDKCAEYENVINKAKGIKN